jgi:hypothetical protein
MIKKNKIKDNSIKEYDDIVIFGMAFPKPLFFIFLQIIGFIVMIFGFFLVVLIWYAQNK